MKFGMHKGKMIKQLMKKDPGYIVWLYEEKVLKLEPSLYEESKKLKEEKDSKDNSFQYLSYGDMEF